MKIWKVILAVLVIFGAGVVTGGLLVNFTDGARGHRHRPPEPRPEISNPVGHPPALTNSIHENSNRLAMPFGSPPRRNMSKEFLERLDHELKFTPEQRGQLEKILDESQKHAKEVWDKIAPEMREEMKKSREKMREVFTPEQNARFDELMKPLTPKPSKDTALTAPISTNAAPQNP